MLPFVFLVFAAHMFIGSSKLSNGVNLQPSYYNGGEVTFGWSLMEKHREIKMVRIEVEPDKVSVATEWIKEAASKNYDIIVTYHKCSVLGSDNTEELKEAADWWVTNYAMLRQSGDFTMNLMNEWGSHDQTEQSYADAYNSAIHIIRSGTNYKGDIIIDIPGWGQETLTAANASPNITDKSVILSAHVYPGGYNQGEGRYLVSSDMDQLVSTGRRCIIGEFGFLGDGPVDVEAVVSHAKSIGFQSVISWAWNGDGGDMNMVYPAWKNSPQAMEYTEGEYFHDGIYLL